MKVNLAVRLVSRRLYTSTNQCLQKGPNSMNGNYRSNCSEIKGNKSYNKVKVTPESKQKSKLQPKEYNITNAHFY